MDIYTNIMRPALFRLNPEDAHHLVLSVARRLAPALSFLPAGTNNPALKVNVGGSEFANPIGLAAGFDKNGVLPAVLGSLGFGFAEVGSVSARPCAGNPRPRLFRLPEDHAVINRLGLNGEGVDVVAERLARLPLSLPVGVNIAKTNDPTITGERAVADILYSFEKVKALPIAYVTLNASCPNTEEAMLSEVEQLSLIFSEIQKINDRSLPLLVKLSPDSPGALVADIVAAARRFRLAGYVCGNTTTTRSGLKTPADVVAGIGAGGLSGAPLRPLALDLCRRVYALKEPGQFILAAGGIGSGRDAYDFIRAGASAVQIYTALIYGGPWLPGKINEELALLLGSDRLSLAEAVGKDVVQERSV